MPGASSLAPPLLCYILPLVSDFEKAPPDVQEILSKPIREMGLKLEGSPLERFVQQLYKELDRKGVRKFRPQCYLSDEWGCPDQQPVIGIPFYLADPKLARLEREMNDLEDSRQIMMYLRHEAGHAFNYAYQLFKTQEWRDLFGPFRRPYRDLYRPVPFSRQFVRHIEGWYAQKHPDEDFAETFAVWLTTGSRWRQRYKGWGAMKKLRYMERVAHQFGEVDPFVKQGMTDITVDEMEVTVRDFYENAVEQHLSTEELTLDTDLTDIFNVSRKRKTGVRPATEFLRENRRAIVEKVTYWTGVQRPMVRKLLDAVEDRAAKLDLKVDIACERQHLTELVTYVTALAMNYISRGKFVLP